jgi:hypothetical protein
MERSQRVGVKGVAVDVDPQLQTLGLQLANVAVRNTASSVFDRITVAKARKKDQETIAELEEIITGLLSDKSELIGIAQAYEQELVAQRISESDIEYISTNFVPLLQQLMESAAASDGQPVDNTEEMIALIQPLLSVETVTVLQLIGFNFRRAIGEPLTQLVSQLILSKAYPNPALALEIQRLSLGVAQDPEAFDRLVKMVNPPQ